MNLQRSRLLLLVCLVAGRLAADCNYAARSSIAVRLTASDVAVDGSDLWVATSYGVALYDRSFDPPRPLSSLAIAGATTRVRATGGIAYAASGSRVHVVKKGRYLTAIRSVDTGASIAELLLSQGYLYAATSTGIVQLTLADPESPSILNRLTTSGGPAFSLARLDATLYAADGDTTVEAYSLQAPTLPQKVGTIPTTLRAASVRNAGGRLYVSDGFTTEVFLGSGTSMTRAGSAPHGATSLFPLGGDVIFAAGIDRRVRAIDFSLPQQAVVVFDGEIAPSAGSVNRIQAMTGTPGRLYLAAGDRGVVTFDTRDFAAPYPFVANAAPLARSIVSLGDSVVVADDEAGLRRYAQAANGRLTAQTPWDLGRRSAVHDAAAHRLLASSGTLLNLWDLSKSPPERIGNAAFARPVRSAALAFPIAIAVLDDASVYRVDFSQTPATATRVSIAGAAPSYVARGGSAIALVDLTEEGTTVIRYFAPGDLGAAPAVATLEGSATGGVALTAGGLAAASTFKGISIVRFPAATVETIPASAGAPARAVAVAGSEIFRLTSSALEVWDAATKSMPRSYALPAESYAMSLSPDPARKILSIAGASGIVSILPASPSKLPVEIAASNANRYYRRILASDRELLLGTTDGREIDRYTLAIATDPRFDRTLVLQSPAIGFAAIGGIVYALSGSGTISAYGGAADALLFEYAIDEGSPISPQSIHAVAGALWVSLLKGCPGAGCEQKTLVLDPRGGRIVPTISMTGELLDVAVSGARAYVLTSAPSEIRIFDTTDPYHPLMLMSRAAGPSSMSIAYAPASKLVYTLGNDVRAYSESSLAESGAPVEVGGVGSIDQRLRAARDCALVTGRSFSPLLFSGAWQPLVSPSTPSAVRGVAVRDEVIYLLTEQSIEAWSVEVPGRRRGAR